MTLALDAVFAAGNATLSTPPGFTTIAPVPKGLSVAFASCERSTLLLLLPPTPLIVIAPVNAALDDAMMTWPEPNLFSAPAPEIAAVPNAPLPNMYWLPPVTWFRFSGPFKVSAACPAVPVTASPPATELSVIGSVEPPARALIVSVLMRGSKFVPVSSDESPFTVMALL